MGGCNRNRCMIDYDTNLKKKIIWNGTEWTNMDGTNLI